jgi:DNA-binding GntR family transcriptional regulator
MLTLVSGVINIPAYQYIGIQKELEVSLTTSQRQTSNGFLWGVAARHPIQPLRVYAYEAIKSSVILRRWAVGDPLHEDQLAEELGMSRTPVREALQALDREGFVQILPARGTFVAGLSTDDLCEIFEYREALESQTARLAAEKATQENFQELEEILVLSEESFGGVQEAQQTGETYRTILVRLEELHRVGREFHGCVARIAGNVRIQEALSNLLCLTIPTRVEYTLTRSRAIQEEHRSIFRDIVSRNTDAAERRMRTHIHAHAIYPISQIDVPK